MARVFLGLGSNQGDRLANLSRAAQKLAGLPDTRVAQMATISETDPVGGPPQERFLNTVIEVETTLSPQELLAAIQRLERDLGRTPSTVRWGPRPIDVDILFYEDRQLNEPALTIPHQDLHTRRFVLEPLAQLAPDFVHPILQRTVVELLAALQDH